MDCREVRELLSTYCDMEVSEGERLLIEEHLAVCEGCRKEFQELRAIIASLKDLEPVLPPPSFREGLRMRLLECAKEKPLSRWSGLFRWLRQVVWGEDKGGRPGNPLFIPSLFWRVFEWLRRGLSETGGRRRGLIALPVTAILIFLAIMTFTHIWKVPDKPGDLLLPDAGTNMTYSGLKPSPWPQGQGLTGKGGDGLLKETIQVTTALDGTGSSLGVEDKGTRMEVPGGIRGEKEETLPTPQKIEGGGDDVGNGDPTGKSDKGFLWLLPLIIFILGGFFIWLRMIGRRMRSRKKE